MGDKISKTPGNTKVVKDISIRTLEKVKSIWTLLFVLSVLNILLGCVSLFFTAELHLNLSFGIFIVIAGITYGVLGYLVKSKHLLHAVIIALILLITDLILGVIVLTGSLISIFMVKIYFIIIISGGIGPLRKSCTLNLE